MKTLMTKKTIKINYAYDKFITVLVPRKKRNKESLVDALVSGSYKTFEVKVVEGLDELIKHVVKNANDKGSNGGRWYAHCNGYCLDVVVDYKSKDTGIITLNSYYEYRKSSR